jgi:hypothetical protein
MTLLASLARRTSNLHSRSWFRVWILIASCVVLIDLWLTVRVYAPRARIAALPVENTDVILGEGSPQFRPPVDVGYGSQSENVTRLEGEGDRVGRKEKLFIASIHWNDEEILSSHWITALLSFINAYGASNLYISVLESGSWDNTKLILQNLDWTLESLGVERSVVLEERTHEDELKGIPEEGEKEGWIVGTTGKKEMRRIPYLAAARNRAMAPLRMLARREGEGRRVFDRVVWLNDVIFSVRPLSPLPQSHPSNQTFGGSAVNKKLSSPSKSPHY